MKMEKQMNDTNKLDGDDWVRLLKVFPQFAQYCNWEKLSRKNWIDLVEARPEFATSAAIYN